MSLMKKLQSYMLGAVDEEDDMLFEEEYEEEIAEEEPYYKERERPVRSSSRSAGSSRRSSAYDRKVLSLPGSNYSEDNKKSIYICRPEVVDDATTVCDYLKNGIICAVNLEGVDRSNAQRIADFLGGACFALDGEIQRITNEVFIIAPNNIEVSSEIKDEFKSGGLVLPWISSAFK